MNKRYVKIIILKNFNIFNNIYKSLMRLINKCVFNIIKNVKLLTKIL